MELSLKDMNRPGLGLVLLANISVYVTALSGRFSSDAWIATLTNIQDLTPILALSVLTGVINAQLGHTTKLRLGSCSGSGPTHYRAVAHLVSTHARTPGSTPQL